MHIGNKHVRLVRVRDYLPCGFRSFGFAFQVDRRPADDFARRVTDAVARYGIRLPIVCTRKTTIIKN